MGAVIFMNIIYSSNVESPQIEEDVRNIENLKETILNNVGKGKTDIAAVAITQTKAKSIASR